MCANKEREVGFYFWRPLIKFVEVDVENVLLSPFCYYGSPATHQPSFDFFFLISLSKAAAHHLEEDRECSAWKHRKFMNVKLLVASKGEYYFSQSVLWKVSSKTILEIAMSLTLALTGIREIWLIAFKRISTP